MKQPQLGHKILELRKAKGLTQEELVEKCNLNVRTLQRIEAGEVSPRSHTLKTIFEVLDFDFNEKPFIDPQEILNNLQNSSRLSADPRLTKTLGISLIAGAFYYILAFLEMGMDVSLLTDYPDPVSPFWVLFKNDLSPISPFWYFLTKFLVMTGFGLFIYGFYVLGKKLENSWLVFSSLLYIIIFGLTIIADLLFFWQPNWPLEYYLTSKAIIYGIGLLLFSLALLTARHVLGSLALVAGALGIANGLFFASIFFALPGILLLTWVELLQLILLFKARLLFSKKSSNQKIVAEIAE